MKTKNFRIIVPVCISLFVGLAINTKAQKAELVVQTGHTKEIQSVAFSPDGKLLASGGDDGVVKIWDLSLGKELKALTGLPAIKSMAFSPDGRTIVAISFSSALKKWNLETGKELEFSFYTGLGSPIIFSPDGKLMALEGSSEIVLWNAVSWQPVKTIGKHNERLISFAFSPDGTKIASAGMWDNSIKLWDVTTGEELKTLSVSVYRAAAIRFSHDGQILAAGGASGTVKLWDIESGQELRSFAALPDIKAICFSLDSKTLISVSEEGSIELWNIGSGQGTTFLNEYGYIQSAAFSPNAKTVAIGGRDRIVKLLDVTSGKKIKDLDKHSNAISCFVSSPDNKALASGDLTGNIQLWNIPSGKDFNNMSGHTQKINTLAFSPNSKLLASGSSDNTIKLWEVSSGKEMRTLSKHAHEITVVAFSPDGKTLASGSHDKSIKLWNVESGRERESLSGYGCWVGSIKFSPDGKTLALGQCVGQGTVKLWNVESGQELTTLKGQSYKEGFSVSSIAFSPDGKILASGRTDARIDLWDLSLGRLVGTLDQNQFQIPAWIDTVAFSADGKILASGKKTNSREDMFGMYYDYSTITLWHVGSGGRIETLHRYHVDTTREIYSVVPDFYKTYEEPTTQDGQFQVTKDKGNLNLLDVKTGALMVSLIALDENDWVVVTPDGRFDTNKAEDSQRLHWVVSDDSMKPVPLEVFMRDYYEPKLLSRLLQCNKLNICDREFKPLPNIAELNRVQPPVKITSVSFPDTNRRVKVTVEVGKGAVPHKECRMKRCETGVYDLRLFRDSQIVGTFPNDGQAELIRQSQRFKTSIVEKDLWRKVSGIKLGKTTECQTGGVECATQTFEIELPQGKNVADIEFTAYAFNEDRVKSQTAKWEWPLVLMSKLPKAQLVKPRAYVIAVGVSAYENSDFDLEFAADDARRMSEVVTQKLNATDQYENVTQITLISDYETRGGRRVTTEKQATKENFHAVLDLLAGKNVDRRMLTGIKNADQLQKTTPDDFVLIMYSSHGYADRAGNFYFFPYDTGPGKGKIFTEGVRRHSISSDELSLWLRDVDAGDMIMIVDACHSAAAIEGSEFKPGPMGSRGLGQLSYDKGMKILAATQSDNVALENKLIKQGLLTYALVQDGIEARQADFKPKDNVINIGEWLTYGVDRVPKLYEEVKAGKIQDFGVTNGSQTKVIVATQSGKSSAKSLEEVVVAAKAQQPSLFDFTRKRREVALVK